MKTGTLYHLESGAVLGHVRGTNDADFSSYASADVGVYEGAELYRETEYVDTTSSPLTVGTRTAVVLSVSPAAPVLGDVITVSGLPVPCWVRYGDALHQLNSSTLQFTPDEAGTHAATLVGAYAGEVMVVVRGTAQGALDADARWSAVRTATPAQIDAWLTANVTNLAQARDVLKLLILAVRKLGA